jgi:hypothetical protein
VTDTESESELAPEISTFAEARFGEASGAASTTAIATPAAASGKAHF